MSMNSLYLTEYAENLAPKSAVRRATKFRSALKKQVWFAGLYVTSLVCLGATGATVRLTLAAL